MSDLIRRADAIQVAYKIVEELAESSLSWDDLKEWAKGLCDNIPTAEPKEYVKDGTLTIQMPTIKEAKAIDKIVVYADTYKQEYYMPLPKVGRWIMHIDDIFPADSTQECSRCREHQRILNDDNYCPNCGAKMER